MRIPVLLLCLASAGCNRKLASTCEQVGTHVLGLFGGANDRYATEMQIAFEMRCTADAWSSEMRSCLTSTKSLVEPKNCKQKLTPEQSKNLDAAILAADEREAMKIMPGSCLRYEKMLAGVATCEALPKEMRDQLAASFAAFKATWPTVKDMRTLDPTCGSAIHTVKQVAAECPGAKTW